MEINTSIYSIGHGARPIDIFLQLLLKYDINYVVDVRTKPRSRFNPQYNKDRFAAALREHGITYVYMGDTLGGMPTDKSCYDQDGRVDYTKVKEKDFFKNSLARLKTAHEKNIRIACVCSELAPCECHRSKLIGESLRELQVPILHINKQGDLEDQATVIKKIRGEQEADLFGKPEENLKSRRIYL